MAHIADLLMPITSSSPISIKAKESFPSPVSIGNTDLSAVEEEPSGLQIWKTHPSIEESSPLTSPPFPFNIPSPVAVATDVSPRKRQFEVTLNRRRKISVPELAPMTTVQETAMDSPTIPGRPPVHSRSLSLPVSSPFDQFDKNRVSPLSDSSPIAEDDIDDSNISSEGNSPAAYRAGSQQFGTNSQTSGPESTLINENSNIQVPGSSPKSTKGNQESSTSPNVSKTSPFATILAWSSAVSLPSLSEGRSSPRPWNFGRSSPKPWSITSRSSPKNVSRMTPETVISLPLPSTPPFYVPQLKSGRSSESIQGRSVSTENHQRHKSEEGVSHRLMDRGRPTIRHNHATVHSERGPRCPSSNSNASTNNSYCTDRSSSPYSPPSEKQCFLSLPTGYFPNTACRNFTQTELSQLQNQALAQARRFRVLPSRDVESLSRELRALDERCEYLRATHHSLRNDRKSLHARICSSLNNHRVARFSTEALLKQEESLIELDRSIDGWIGKLEQAENRRMRVRQKLLEHVAAAAIVDKYAGSAEQNTPPRSPQHSPVRLERVLEEVPLRMGSPTPPLSPCAEEDSSGRSSRSPSPSRHSIRVYADVDVYALMDSVEEEIVRLGM